MAIIFHRAEDMELKDHPKFTGVRIAPLITGSDSPRVSVSLLEIAPDTSVPVHTHDPQVDSIFVVAGRGQVMIDGGWRDISAGDHIFVPPGEQHGFTNNGPDPLRIFVHHAPPLQ